MKSNETTDQNMRKEKQTQSIRLINFEEDQVRFQFIDEDVLRMEKLLKTGYRYISDTFFKHDIPTEAETEYAINYIEDQLMSQKELLNNNETLVCTDSLLSDIFIKNEMQQNVYSRQQVEDLFNRYAYVIMGASSSRLNTAIVKEDFAFLLVIREIMHHLNFEAIYLNI